MPGAIVIWYSDQNFVNGQVFRPPFEYQSVIDIHAAQPFKYRTLNYTFHLIILYLSKYANSLTNILLLLLKNKIGNFLTFSTFPRFVQLQRHELPLCVCIGLFFCRCFLFDNCRRFADVAQLTNCLRRTTLLNVTCLKKLRHV